MTPLPDPDDPDAGPPLPVTPEQILTEAQGVRADLRHLANRVNSLRRSVIVIGLVVAFLAGGAVPVVFTVFNNRRITQQVASESRARDIAQCEAGNRQIAKFHRLIVVTFRPAPGTPPEQVARIDAARQQALDVLTLDDCTALPRP